jgi:hypothetical protein
MKSITDYWKNYSPEDKVALKELQREMSEKTGKSVSIGEAIKALEPDLETPEELNNI